MREGRALRSSTKANTNDPEYDETFVLLVRAPAGLGCLAGASDEYYAYVCMKLSFL